MLLLLLFEKQLLLASVKIFDTYVDSNLYCDL